VESKAGPPRKYYVITKQGSAFLMTLKSTWVELSLSTEQIISVKSKKMKK
jgi:PadR family transcriptional regulator PadR